ncbi:Flp pilus assembly protein TadD [Kineosphaera limosa]|uniref:Tetratricopeptide repeat protein n=1 Tax=Kineosphaera limosa NBRC 100340 TaxID=1184609 RepID=K6X1M9_9MICO|nr:hypothetical protein [Kineosphaera limosa]NYE01597.1 Flp pilus assembly protein TadD [Kineosphaera limosa]GAB98267.1 hypothetical protein KILIM_120_00020 [Kineosphaera limosa NBRC 100340]
MTMQSMQRSAYDEFRWAQELFARRDPAGAAKVLEGLLDRVRGEADSQTASAEQVGAEQVGAVRTELMRAYFHTARLGPAEALAREALDADPTDSDAALLLARVLQRRSRHDEVAALLPRLEALLGADDEGVALLRGRAR